MARNTFYSSIAQANRREHPLSNNYQCYVGEGIETGNLDRSGNLVTANTNINYSTTYKWDNVPSLNFGGNSWFDVPLNLDSFNGVIGAIFRVETLPNNVTIWTNSNDGVSFAYGLFVLSDRTCRIHAESIYDLDVRLALNQWHRVTLDVGQFEVIANVNGKLYKFLKGPVTGTNFVRVGHHSKKDLFNFPLYGNIARFWIS